MHRTEMTLVPTVLLVSVLRPATACAFHCRTSVCGSSPIEFIEYSFDYGPQCSNYVQFPCLNATGGDEGTRNYMYPMLSADLRGRGITSLQPGAVGCWDPSNGTVSGLLLDGNPLVHLPDMVKIGGTGTMFVSMTNCSIDSLAPGAMTSYFTASTEYVNLRHNNVTLLPSGMFAGSNTANGMRLDLSYNKITWLEPDIFNDTFSPMSFSVANNRLSALSNRLFAPEITGVLSYIEFSAAENLISDIAPGVFGISSLSVSMFNFSHNKLTTLQGSLLAGVSSTNSITFDVTNNKLVHVGNIFGDTQSNFTAFGSVNLNIAHNCLSDVTALVTSYMARATLIVDVSSNNYSHLDFLPSEEVYSGHGTPFVFNVSSNPLKSISSSFFQLGGVYGDVTIDISYPTTGSVVFPYKFNFENSFMRSSTLHFVACGTNATVESVLAFSTFLGPSGCGSNCNLTLVLRDNNITDVPQNAFANAHITTLDLAYNAITMFAGDAFNYTFDVKEIVLSHNLITVLPQQLIDNTPSLERLVLNNNRLVAIPVHFNRISTKTGAAEHNPLQCTQYGPIALGCRCKSPDLVVNMLFGYVRCTPTITGCSNGSYLNATDVSNAPWSVCFTDVPLGFYYDTTAQALLPLTNCARAFKLRNSTAYLRAYEYAPATINSDRQCSICAVCPVSYIETPCTATSDTACTKDGRLSVAAIASIVLAIVLVVVIGSAASLMLYAGKKRKEHELSLTARNLTVTTQELHGERAEKERMELGWSIDEGDLQLDEILGEGATGRVWRGTWGHIRVAIKVLKEPIDDLSPNIAENFRKELSFMRSVRHPHLLSFYGGGVNSDANPYLVTELMERGCLKSLLHDLAKPITWTHRLVFASDIAAAMRYLHDDAGAVHRDLKAENCFVDTDWRVKVGDFGTSRISSARLWINSFPSEGCAHRTSSVSSTLTAGTGSWLWMAPEVFAGKVTVEQAEGLDVYSFAVVLFEIWTRLTPWSEIEVNDAEFYEELRRRVTSGERPAIPASVGAAPSGYEILMGHCWTQRQVDRPPFRDIVEALITITADYTRQKFQHNTYEDTNDDELAELLGESEF